MNIKKSLFLLLFPVLGLFLFQSCDITENDGDSNTPVTVTGGYFYLADKDAAELVMLDNSLTELKRWALPSEIAGESVNGLTDDGKNIWLSCAGSVDKIFSIDAASDSIRIVNSFDAPPDGKGVVRDIAWDGLGLWALNSGSSTYGLGAALYNISEVDGTVLNEVSITTPEPRGLTFIGGYENIYGSGLEAGFYFSDVEEDMIYFYRNDRPATIQMFETPEPPRGAWTKFVNSVTFDGRNLWLLNSSDVSDLMYKVSAVGKVNEQFTVPFDQPGAITWSARDIRVSPPPSVAGVVPGMGAKGETVDIDIIGSNFREGNALSIDLGSGITVNNIVYYDPTKVGVTLSIDANAATGPRNLTFTNGDGQTTVKDSVFTVVEEVKTPYMWVADQASGQRFLYVIRLTDSTVVKEWATTDISEDGIQGVAFDGEDFWLSSSGNTRSVFRLDTAGVSLGVKETIPVPFAGGTIRGITHFDSYLWIAVSNVNDKGYVLQMDVNSGQVIDTLETPGKEVRGIYYVDGILYCNDTSADSVYSYSSSAESWTARFATPIPENGSTSNRFSTGLSYDGTNFWLANSSGDYDNIYKVSPAGTVIQTFDVPRSGSAQLTGIVYTLK